MILQRGPRCRLSIVTSSPRSNSSTGCRLGPSRRRHRRAAPSRWPGCCGGRWRCSCSAPPGSISRRWVSTPACPGVMASSSGSTAWAQVMLAGLLVLGPARRSIQIAIVVNFAVIVVWLVSRTVGIAIGTDGTPEPVEFADTLCTVFEGLTIALGLVVICGGVARRRIRLGAGGRSVRSWRSSSPRSPASGSAPRSPTAAVVVILADGGGAEVAASGSAAAASTPAAHDSRLDRRSRRATDLNGHDDPGRQGARRRRRGPARRAARRRDPRRCSQQQLVAARDTAMRYPTVADAQAAGYHLVGGFGPGSGAHYIGGPVAASAARSTPASRRR